MMVAENSNPLENDSFWRYREPMTKAELIQRLQEDESPMDIKVHIAIGCCQGNLGSITKYKSQNEQDEYLLLGD